MGLITGKYKITDCENRGDVSSAVSRLEKLGCTDCVPFWDGNDCGEAYVKFMVSEDKFLNVYERICRSCEFDANINDYIRFNNRTNYKFVGVKTLKSLWKAQSNNISDGFQNKQLFVLYFESDNNKEDLTKLLEALFNEWNVHSEVICYSCNLEEGDWCYRVLLNVSCIVDSIPSLKLATSMFFKKIGLRATLHVTHDLSHYNNEVYKQRVESVVNKAELEYHNTRYEKKRYPYSEYAVSLNGATYLKTEFHEGNNKYYL